VGILEGFEDGQQERAFGCTEGSVEGNVLGFSDGKCEGSGDGFVEGSEIDGLRVGRRLGIVEGFKDGVRVGQTEGVEDGRGRGDGDVVFDSILDGEKDVGAERIGFVDGSFDGSKNGVFVTGFVDGAGIYDGWKSVGTKREG